jgi:proline iminopeptidase
VAVGTDRTGERLLPRAGHVSVGNSGLYVREIGDGPPIVVLHGGPDFDHTYLLPELDVLAGSFRLILYDQRGRGRSATGVDPSDVSIGSEVSDLAALRRHFELDHVALLGHSWGCLLAMEFAVRQPELVSRLILLNTAPASHDDFLALRRHIQQIRPAGDVKRMQAITASAAFASGDIDTEADYYRLHFRPTLRSPVRLEQLVRRLRRHFTAQSVLMSRAIEQRLFDETWSVEGYDLAPRLASLDIPTLVLHGDHDFIPVEIATRVAAAIPGAHLSVLPSCGHFCFLDALPAVDEEIRWLFRRGD